MQEALEQERVSLEEVVRAEIKVRISSNESLKDLITKALSAMGADVALATKKCEEGVEGAAQKCEDSMREVAKKCDVLLDAQRKLYSRQQELATANKDLEQVGLAVSVCGSIEDSCSLVEYSLVLASNGCTTDTK